MMVLAQTPEARAIVAGYLRMRIGEMLVGDMPYGAAAVISGNEMAGGILFTNFRGSTVEIALAGKPGWLTRGVVRSMFRHVFLDLGALCCCSIVRRDNGPSRLLASRLGGREAGVIEHAFGQGLDGILYTMTREACPWIEDCNHGKVRAKKPEPRRGRQRANRIEH